MGVQVTYDDSLLWKLFAEMDVKRRKQALKGAFRKEANSVRKRAVANLKQSIRTSKDMERCVRALVFKDEAGFRVTVGSKRGVAGKPILVWAEMGTQQRKTKGSGGRRGQGRRASHPTGQMRAYEFMRSTAAQVDSTVTAEIQEELRASVYRTAMKYGCH